MQRARLDSVSTHSYSKIRDQIFYPLHRNMKWNAITAGRLLGEIWHEDAPSAVVVFLRLSELVEILGVYF